LVATLSTGIGGIQFIHRRTKSLRAPSFNENKERRRLTTWVANALTKKVRLKEISS